MGSSTLTPENLPAGPDRRIHQGHGTAALGPSDSSDSGSDMMGVPGNEESDGDTDRNGSGERADVEGDTDELDGADIGTDRIEKLPPEPDA